MEKNWTDDNTNGDDPCDANFSGNHPHRPSPAPAPAVTTQVLSHGLITVGEFGYGIDTSTAGVSTLKFWDSSTTPPFQYAAVLDFFSYNPISSAYPRAGIVNLYTRNAPVLAAIISQTLKTGVVAECVFVRHKPLHFKNYFHLIGGKGHGVASST